MDLASRIPDSNFVVDYMGTKSEVERYFRVEFALINQQTGEDIKVISARRCVAKDFGMAQQIWQAYSLKKTNLICPSDLEKIEINNLG